MVSWNLPANKRVRFGLSESSFSKRQKKNKFSVKLMLNLKHQLDKFVLKEEKIKLIASRYENVSV